MNKDKQREQTAPKTTPGDEREPYAPPAVEDEEVFENFVLGCTQVQGGRGCAPGAGSHPYG